MKLRNKITGDIVRVEFLNNWQTDDGTEIGFRECNTNIVYSYTSLAELNSEWEDVPEEHWFISEFGNVYSLEHIPMDKERTGLIKAIGNHFETKEEAEKAVEKLKAWKRLKDKGIEIIDYNCYGGTNTKGEFSGKVEVIIDVPQDVDKYLFDLLFGGEA